MPSSDSSRDSLLERLAEEFVERHRRGEHPALSEYTDRHPDLAAEIRDLFPALVQIEHLKPVAGDLTGDFVPQSGPADGRTPERLGEYRILREVGHGGMGVVYEAEQESLGRHVALKVLPRQALLKTTYLERFRREAKAAAKLHHTNIVPVFGVGECDGTHYYVMQFIRGEGLDKVLADLRRLRATPGAPTMPAMPSEASVAHSLLTGRFDAPAAPPAEEPTAPSSPVTAAEGAHGSSTLSAGGPDGHYYRGIARVGLQVADALAYAHRQGILHRDVKPSNLLLDQQGTVWITDFGLAKAEGADDLTATGDIVGTLRFMAPERFDGRSLPQSDVYGLGVTLYEMLTLRPPFDDTHKGRLIEKVLHEPPAPPRRLDPRVPRDLETIVLKCLAKEPAERYAAAEVLAEDLRRFLADRPIKARRTPWHERTWRWCRRNPVVASLLATVGALLVAVAVMSAFYAAHQKTAATDLAEALTKAQLREAEALIGQAHGTRLSRRPGQRIEALAALAKAAAIGQELDRPPEWFDQVRTEAIAALALPDVEVLQEWEGAPAGTVYVDFDSNLERYARQATDGTVSVRRIRDDVEIARWQERTEGPWLAEASNLLFSPDGRFLCVRHSASGRLTVRRLDGPEPILYYQGSKARGDWGISYSPDSKQLAYLQTDSRIAVVDLTSRQVRSLPPTGAEPQNFIQFAPDGRRFALAVNRAGKGAVEVRDVATGQVRQSLAHPKGNNYPAWHPDGRTLASCCDDHLIRLWDVASGRLLRELEGHKSWGILCAFTPTGDRLVSNDWNGLLRIWEPSSGRQLLSFAAAWVNPRVSSDGRVAEVHIADDTRIQLLRLHPGLEYRTISPAVSRRRDIQYASPTIHPGGRLLAATGPDGAVVVIDLAAGREVATLPAPADGECPLLWDPSGNLLTCGTSGCVRWPVRADPAEPSRYRLGPGEQLLWFRRPNQWGSSADGQTIAVPNLNRGAVVVHRGQLARTIRLQPQQDVRHCAVSPDGRWVATGSHGNTDGWGAKVWDAATGELAKEFRLPGRCAVRFSPDGRWLLTTSGGCRLWEVGSWKEGPKVGGRSGCFSPDGRLLAVEASAGAIRLVRPESGRELARLEAPEHTMLWPGCFTPDGTQLIAHGEETRALHVWDLRLIRKGLTRLGLDWDAPPYPEAADGVPSPLDVTILGTRPPDPMQLNNRAWRLATGPADQRDPVQALKLIQDALKLKPDEGTFLNTLGVIQYRNGQYAAARATLEKSLRITKGEFAAFDLYFLAMCHAKLGEAAKAKDCLDRAVKWTQKDLPGQAVEELKAFRAEAEAELRAR
jgi:serine/threonine protein kinase/WD40 repeat protein